MGDPLAGHPAPERVESRPQRGILPKGLHNAEPGELPHVRKGRPRQCDRGGPGYGRRHVRHAVMDHALLDVERVRMRRRTGRLQGASLVDGNVHHDRSPLHPPKKVPPDEDGSLVPGKQHGGDHEVRPDHVPFDRYGRGKNRTDAAACLLPDPCKLFPGDVEHGHARPDPRRRPRRVPSRDPRPDHAHRGRLAARDRGKENPPASRRFFQPPGPHLDGHDPRHLAHRAQEGKLDVPGHRFVGDRRYLPGHQLIRQLREGGQVEVGEQGRPVGEKPEFPGKGFLHLYDEIDAPGVRLVRDDRRSPPGELRVREPASNPRAFLDEHPRSCLAQRTHAPGGRGDPVLPFLDLPRDADAKLHLFPPAIATRESATVSPFSWTITGFRSISSISGWRVTRSETRRSRSQRAATSAGFLPRRPSRTRAPRISAIISAASFSRKGTIRNDTSFVTSMMISWPGAAIAATSAPPSLAPILPAASRMRRYASRTPSSPGTCRITPPTSDLCVTSEEFIFKATGKPIRRAASTASSSLPAGSAGVTGNPFPARNAIDSAGVLAPFPPPPLPRPPGAPRPRP